MNLMYDGNKLTTKNDIKFHENLVSAPKNFVIDKDHFGGYLADTKVSGGANNPWYAFKINKDLLTGDKISVSFVVDSLINDNNVSFIIYNNSQFHAISKQADIVLNNGKAKNVFTIDEDCNDSILIIWAGSSGANDSSKLVAHDLMVEIGATFHDYCPAFAFRSDINSLQDQINQIKSKMGGVKRPAKPLVSMLYTISNEMEVA